MTENWKTSKELEEFFPNVDIDMRPTGNLVCCQVKMPRRKMGSIILADVSQDYDKWNTMIAKLVKVGPVAFKEADTLEPWPEGAWAEVGQYVIIPKYGSVKFAKAVDGHTDKCVFAFLRDKDIRAVITGNPLEVDEYA